MKQFRLAAILLAIILILTITAIPAAAEANADEVDVLVGFDPGQMRTQIARHDEVGSLGGEIRRQFTLIDAVAATLPEEAIGTLAARPGIRYVEPDGEVQALGQSVPWGIDRIFGPEQYPFPSWGGSTGAGVGVAVLDTGIDAGHEDLPALAGGMDLVYEDEWDRDPYGHGTHVAGTVAALDDHRGVVGAAPGVDLYSVRVLDGTGSGQISDLVAGIEWAVQKNIPIINMSLGAQVNYQSLGEVCGKAFAAGHLLVAAAGNVSGGSDGDDVFYPAAYESVLAVSASDGADELAAFSATGPEVELIAPGVDIKSTGPATLLARPTAVDGRLYPSHALEGSGVGSASRPIIDCGLALEEDGVEDPPELGWIALIARGEIYFSEKVRNVMGQGAMAAIIVNDDRANPDDPGHFTLHATEEDEDFEWIPTVSVSYNSGGAMRGGELEKGTVRTEYTPYMTMSGTSMASAHVSGAAALALGANPDLDSEGLWELLAETAEDLGLPSGHQGAGMVRADRAVTEAVGEVEYSLQVDIDGAGTVEVQPKRDYYHFGEQVTLTAVAEQGWEFVEWTGDVTGVEAETTVTIQGDTKVMAVFAEEMEEVDLPAHSVYLGHTAVSIDYLSADPAKAVEKVNALIDDQDLDLLDLWYRIEEEPVSNMATGEKASSEQLQNVRRNLVWYVDEQGEKEELRGSMTASVEVVVGAMSFAEITVTEIKRLEGAAHFSVPGRDKLAALGDVLTVVRQEEHITLKVWDQQERLLAVGEVPIEDGEHEVKLSIP